MKIILSANTGWYLWNFRLNLMKVLLSQGHTVIAVSGKDAYTGRFEGEGIQFIPLSVQAKSTNPINQIATIFSFARIFKTEKPDLIFLYTIKPNLYASLAAGVLKIPVVNNVSGLGASFEKNNLLNLLVQILYRLAFSKVLKVFFQNEDDRLMFIAKRLVKPDITGILPGSGVDISRFIVNQKSGGPFTFLFIGRLLKAKGVEDFISAARIIRLKSTAKTRFILIGGHDPNDTRMASSELLETAKVEGLIEIPGQVEDVKEWLAKADCVVLPSYYREGVPRALLEAAASGKPLIAADSIGTREPVVDGINGFLCKPRNPEDLADKMLKLIQLDQKKLYEMGKSSRKIAETRFDEKIVILAYLDIIERFGLELEAKEFSDV